jgi:hypothetical protein
MKIYFTKVSEFKGQLKYEFEHLGNLNEIKKINNLTKNSFKKS